MDRNNKQSKSADFLKTYLAQKIKSVFVKALTCVEIRFGQEFDGYAPMRAEILRIGNDAIRECENLIDERFIIEMTQDLITIKFKIQVGKS